MKIIFLFFVRGNPFIHYSHEKLFAIVSVPHTFVASIIFMIWQENHKEESAKYSNYFPQLHALTHIHCCGFQQKFLRENVSRSINCLTRKIFSYVVFFGEYAKKKKESLNLSMKRREHMGESF